MSVHENMTLKLPHSKNYQMDLRTAAKFWCMNFHHKLIRRGSRILKWGGGIFVIM